MNRDYMTPRTPFADEVITGLLGNREDQHLGNRLFAYSDFWKLYADRSIIFDAVEVNLATFLEKLKEVL